MSSVEKNQKAIEKSNIKFFFNFFNIPQPTNMNNNSNSSNVMDPRSPSPSMLSENSVECSLSGHNMASDVASMCSEESEQELTNLTWLTELRNQSLTWPDSIQPIIDNDSSDRKCHSKGTKGVCNKANEGNFGVQQKRPTPSERYETFLDKVKKDIIQYDLSARTYQMDATQKPPFNYSHIIGMAMIENGRMTLQQICSWIESKFAFFRVRKKWNNSIRHNLSLHHCFRKIDRSKYEKGKGGYWELGIDPKKCDRKRIRNRKVAKSKFVGEIKERRPTKETHIKNCETISCPQVDRIEKFVLDELDVQQNIVLPKESKDKIHSEFLLSNTMLTESRLPLYDNNGPIQLQDVFIADVSSCGKAMPSSNLSVAAEYQLGTIIVNSSTADLSAPGANVNEMQQQMNVIVEEIPQSCENVVISSYLSSENRGNQGLPNVIVEQMEPYYTVSTTESNFRPYIDGIDEAFQYLRSMDSRCDDLFDNLLDISVSDY